MVLGNYEYIVKYLERESHDVCNMALSISALERGTLTDKWVHKQTEKINVAKSWPSAHLSVLFLSLASLGQKSKQRLRCLSI